jgi:hypothetical protein
MEEGEVEMFCVRSGQTGDEYDRTRLHAAGPCTKNMSEVGSRAVHVTWRAEISLVKAMKMSV